MNRDHTPPDWNKDDPLWRALGALPEAQLPPGFARKVMARVAQTRRPRPALPADLLRCALAALRPVLAGPRLAAAAALALAAAALLRFGYPAPVAPSGPAALKTDDDIELVADLDAVLAAEEAEQWLYASLN